MSLKIARLASSAVVALAVACGAAAMAQVAPATDQDLQTAPPQFRSQVSGGKFTPDASELVKAPVPRIPPSADPRDFNGIYTAARMTAGPGGAPSGPGGSPPGGPGPASAGPAAGGPPRTAGGGQAPSRSVGATACVPDFPSLGSYSTMFVQNPAVTLIVMEENHGLRLVNMNVEHPKVLAPSYSGHSIGRWDGDTLVVDTVGIRTERGPTRHVVERMKKRPDGAIEVSTAEVAADGTEAPGRPITLRWRPDLNYVESICEDFGEAFGINYK